MKNIFLIILISIVIIFSSYAISRNNQSINELQSSYSFYLEQGNFEKAQDYLYLLIKNKDSLSIESLGIYYNKIGILKKKIGKYDSAEFYYKKSLDIGEEISNYLDVIYALNNLAVLYRYKGNYLKSIDFYLKSLSILKLYENKIPENDYCYFMLHYNLAIVYFYKKDHNRAIFHLEQSQSYNLHAKLNKDSKINYYKARCYHQMNDTLKAFIFYKECICQEIKFSGKNHIKVALKNIEFGKFLTNYSFNEDAIDYYRKGLEIYLKKYPAKHPEFSYSYLLLSNYFSGKNQIDSSKIYIQKAIISVVSEYNDTSFYSNPISFNALSKLDYLSALKAKTELLRLIASRATDANEKQKNLDFGIETLNLALEVFNNIREGFLTEENKLFITENEKDLYSLAIEMSMQLFNLTGKPSYKDLALYYSSSCKASLLQTEKLINDALYAQNSTDSTGRELFTIKTEIAAYENLLNDEKLEKVQNQEKINLYQDKLFDLKRKEEALLAELNKNISNNQADCINAAFVQQQLADGETLIDYHIATDAKTGKKKLYAMVVSKNNFQVISQALDTMFDKHLSYVKNHMIHKQGDAYSTEDYTSFTTALHYLYATLIQPAEQYISSDKLILIPDEELSFLSFDILLTKEGGRQRINYANLPYLLKKYAISYLLSAEMISHNGQAVSTPMVYAFAPEYKDGPVAKTRFRFGVLNNLETEIKGLLGSFSGEKFCNESATENNFKRCSSQPAVFHFALHADYDADNPKFSYLAFNQDVKSGTEDGMLYNYEIGLMDLHSPLVVLSGCNTGIGKQVSGEGIMSLARGFFKAGVQSVVHTLWSINDASSSKIMTDFYKYLAQGNTKSRALQLAKLDYLQNTTNTYTDPSYWSGYAICGNNAPLLYKKSLVWYIFGIGALFIAMILFLIKVNKQLKFTPLRTQSLSSV